MGQPFGVERSRTVPARAGERRWGTTTEVDGAPGLRVLVALGPVVLHKGIEALLKDLPTVAQVHTPGAVGQAATLLRQHRCDLLVVPADRMVDATGRILLAGEAAHLFPPFGARGMNSGIADAVAASADDQSVVTQYAAQRQHAARYNREAARTALWYLRPGPVMRLGQHCCAALAPHVPALGRWLETAPYGPCSGPSPDSKY